MPPLEMLDSIVDQLKLAQMQGIWAWDVVAREMVLIVPAILAMLDDNPMQSELAYHIGLQGKFFCHNCWVKGVELHTACEHVDGVAMGPNRDDALSSVETKSCLSESEEGPMHHAHAKTPQINSMWNGQGTDKYTEAVNAVIQGHPVEQFMSPVWRIKGLDPHQDTPVEILHIILLGFVKYFWHDMMSRLNKVQKAELDNEHEWLACGSAVQSLVNINIPGHHNIIADFFGINGDAVLLEASDFVLAQDTHAPPALPIIGCLSETLQNQASSLLLETFQVIGSSDIYLLPQIQPSGWVVLPAMALICGVNVQHNCAGNECTGTSTVPVYEECTAVGSQLGNPHGCCS
ncbi:hypothetical protein F5141DRAFT_1068717 [Pisolithus sp. B1]|nr:hypothetical protein F5141DRAFT_1068717 [Pisolithus sp. B1]